jgi:hypothetical protein
MRGRGRQRTRVIAGALVALALAAAASGCGSGEEAAAEIPAGCLESWNAESHSQTFGRHAYDEHGARQARVALYEPARGATNVKAEETCGVIFSVPEGDEEYGDVGMVVTRFGWASMLELGRAERERREAIQREATDAPNATVLPDGRLEAG